MELTLDQALQKGIDAHKAGNAPEADRYYTAILKANPKHPDANHNMGVLAVGVGKVEAAVPFFKTALEANPNNAQFWLSYIDALIKLDRMTDAKEVFEQAKSKGAKGDGFDRLEEKLNSMKPTKSKKSNGQEPSKKQGLPVIHLYETGQYKEALTQASQLLKQFPNSLTLYNIIGATNQSLGKLEEAIVAYKKALSIKPDFAQAYNNMGLALKDQGKLGESIEAYNKALSIKPDFAQAYNNMSLTLKEQGKLEEAIEALNKALSIKPDNAEAYNNIGLTLKEQGKLEEAILAFNKALSIKSDFAEAYNNMGIILKEQGKLDEAVEAFNKALCIKPDYAEAYNNMGIVLKEQGDLEGAIEAYNKALSINPGFVAVYNNRGIAFKEQGKLDEAIEAYNKALSLMPNNSEVNENLLDLRIQLQGTRLTTLGKNDQSNTLNSELIRQPKYQTLLAICAFLEGDRNSVSKYLKKISTCDPELIAKLKSKDQVFCSAYNHFLLKLIETPLINEPTFVDHQSVFHLGESHCLSYAHNKIQIHGIDYTVVPRITFGGKAYHFSTEKEDAFKAITLANFHNLPDGSKVFLSFGEIDCRPNEGIITAASKLNRTIESIISETVDGYIGWFAEQNRSKNHSLSFFNVPAPIYNEKYTAEVNEEVTSTIKLFNSLLHEIVLDHDFNLIDVFKFTVGKDGFSNNLFHIDDYHLSSSAISEIEEQISTFL